MKAMSAELVHRQPGWKWSLVGKNMPQVLWAFAKLGMHDEQLALKSAEHILPSLKRLTDWSVCALAWSLPRLSTESSLGCFDALPSRWRIHKGSESWCCPQQSRGWSMLRYAPSKEAKNEWSDAVGQAFETKK